jgi:hypothetical protein
MKWPFLLVRFALANAGGTATQLAFSLACEKVIGGQA